MSFGIYSILRKNAVNKRFIAIEKREFIGVLFQCCNVYSRVYLNKETSAYVARCPRCSHPIQINISPKGSSSRFFSAG